MAYIAGIDLGSGATKTVVIDEQRTIIGRGLVKSQADFEAAAQRSLELACEQGGIDPCDVEYIAATGLGRYSLDRRDIQITDLTCAARGAYALFPEALFVLDMGAQCTRAICLREAAGGAGGGGKVKSFRTNEKCAAGSGGFLERISRYLEVTLDQIGEISMQADDPQPISSVCAVLAESEIINHVSEGKTVANILRGAHDSLAGRSFAQLKLVGLSGPVVFVGGVALQQGMVEACKAKFGHEVLVPDHPSHVVALGAAILGLQRFHKRAAATVAA